MIIRESFAEGAMPDAVLHAIEIPDVVMEQKALATVKMLAEGKIPTPLTIVVEITVWLVALIIGGFAGIRLVTRLPWKRPLVVGVASVIVLLVFTFLFPPIWLRVLIDLGLMGGLVWMTRE